MVGQRPGAFVLVGRIVAPVGVRGEVRVEVLSDIPDRFSQGAILRIDGSPCRIQRARRTPKGLLVQFQDVTTRALAEELRGKAVEVPEQEVPPPPKDTYYYYQILGMQVFTNQGDHLGEVMEILPTGSNDVYVARRGTRETLIPALADVVLEVDVARREMRVKLPNGL